MRKESPHSYHGESHQLGAGGEVGEVNALDTREDIAYTS